MEILQQKCGGLLVDDIGLVTHFYVVENLKLLKDFTMHIVQKKYLARMLQNY